MARAGDIIGNPITGERITFLETARDTNGELLRFEYLAPPCTAGPPPSTSTPTRRSASSRSSRAP